MRIVLGKISKFFQGQFSLFTNQFSFLIESACKHELLYRLSFDQVFLNDSFEDGRCHGVIPDPLGIHHGDWPLFANAKAVCFGAVDAVVGSGQP